MQQDRPVVLIPQREGRPLLIGHRGASGYRPEHSASAYRLAFEQGADAVEPDVVVTRDGVLVVRHENEISGTTDVASRTEYASRRTTKMVDGETLTGWFTEDFTWDELKTLRCRERLPKLRPENTQFDGAEPILRLVDVLKLIDAEQTATGREISVVVEIKHAQYFLEIGHDLGSLLQADLFACGWANRPSRVIIESFEMGVLDRLRGSRIHALLVFLMESKGSPADERNAIPARSWAWYRTDAGLDSLVGRVSGISLAKADILAASPTTFGLFKNSLVERAHARGLSVFTWTLRPENVFLAPGFRLQGSKAMRGDWRGEWQFILDAGVDGIFVDHPDLGREILG